MSDRPTDASSRLVFDPLSPAFTTNPYPLLHRLRAEEPVHRSPQGFWLLTRYDDAAAVLRGSRAFATGGDREGLRARLGNGAAFAYVSRRMHLFDPPDHTRLRSLVTRAFTVRRVESMRAHIQALADALLDAAGDADPIDVLAALAHPLPSLVICEMLGVPEADRAQFGGWTGDVAFLLTPFITPDQLAAGERAAAEFMGYIADLVQERRGRLGDDLLSALITAEESGDRLSEDELVANVLFLFSAGHQTTRDLVGNGLLALLRHPEQWRRLASDPSLIPAAVEECLRYDSPVTLTFRTAREDAVVGGTPVAAGQGLFVSIGAANRDPARFPDPDRFDLDRRDNEHLAFGGGIHYCLGAALARAEAQIIFGTLLRRYPRLELAEDVIRWRETPAFRGPVALHVRRHRRRESL